MKRQKLTKVWIVWYQMPDDFESAIVFAKSSQEACDLVSAEGKDVIHANTLGVPSMGEASNRLPTRKPEQVLESGLLVDIDGLPLKWYQPVGRTAVSLPDTPDLWNMIWESRHQLMGFAHTHPGRGTVGPSHCDLTTFSAIELGLGRRLTWWIANFDNFVECRWEGPDKYHYSVFQTYDPQWVRHLRLTSGYCY